MPSCPAIFLVPPPPPYSQLNNLLEKINSYKLPNKHIIIGCTIMPGYIHNIATEILRDSPNVTITYNPEFIAQGDIIKGLLQPDMVLIGEGSNSIGDHLEEHYKRMTENEPTICRMSAEVPFFSCVFSSPCLFLSLLLTCSSPLSSAFPSPSFHS